MSRRKVEDLLLDCNGEEGRWNKFIRKIITRQLDFFLLINDKLNCLSIIHLYAYNIVNQFLSFFFLTEMRPHGAWCVGRNSRWRL